MILVLPLVAALLCGAFNALLITGFGVQPIIATLILMVAGRGLGLLLIGGRVLWFRMPAFEILGSGYLLGLPVRIFVAAGVLLLVAIAPPAHAARALHPGHRRRRQGEPLLRGPCRAP